MEDFRYYTMNRSGDQAYPLIKVTGREYTPENFMKLLYLEFNGTVPRNPVMADYLSGPYDFVTKRIAEVMENMDMWHVHFIPTELSDNKGNTIDDYLAIDIDANAIDALDREKSDYEVDEDDEEDLWISKVVLDKEILSKVPLNERLGFHLPQAPGYYLYHQSVVDAIMALNPTGIYFENIEEKVF